MDNSANLHTIWHSAKTDDLPSSKEMKQTVSSFRDQKLRKKWLVIICSIMLSCIITAVLIITPFKMFTTYIGGGMMAASGVILAVTNIRSLKRFKQLDNCSNQEFLHFLKQTQRNQLFYYKNTQAAIILLHGIGLAFYFYEPIAGQSKWFLTIYILCIIYMVAMWFIVRPRSYKRESLRLKETINRIESIVTQIQ
ncbi:hypothetical protein [Mucilaginibacter ginkgonis]|uniref:Uncharacterized protein n=1 Tax=Mucilaginibacter ginkgonis TaxID=2682091 RepID=A0A6I4HV55_9SPHI|nr:hypothetical protein [Mucilaginibacter ginkgonis]QQL49931.1 hypothetical protein GO620_000320 [Mucilaginibacter ginkgonis]